MSINCTDINYLLEYTRKKYPSSQITNPTEHYSKVDFPDIIMNVYKKGTINFQKKKISSQSQHEELRSNLIISIEKINEGKKLL